MKTILSANGLIEIPEEFREADALKPGQRCEIERVGRGEYCLRVENGSAPNDNWVDWLLACPEKGWFVEPDRSAMTSLQARRHREAPWSNRRHAECR